MARGCDEAGRKMARGVEGACLDHRHGKPSFALRRAQTQSDAKPCYQISLTHCVEAVLQGDVLSEVEVGTRLFMLIIARMKTWFWI